MSELQKPTGEARQPDLRSFWLMFVVEFQNAFSDNLLRWVVTFSMIGIGMSQEKRDSLVPVVGAIFALPFILFSMAGGFFADRFSKRDVSVVIKCAEILFMSVASIGLWTGNLLLSFVMIFLMSTHSAIFGPTKYGMLPEMLPEKKLSWGNGIFGLGTFSSTIIGMIAAGTLSDMFGKNQLASGLILIVLAFLGLLLSLQVRRGPPANPNKEFQINFFGDFISQLKIIYKDRVLFFGTIGNAFLWFLGALLQLVILFYGKDIFHFDDRHSSYMQGTLLVGIGLGSLVAGFLSGGKIEYGLIPLGMTGLTVTAAMFFHFHFGITGFAINLALLGFFGGIYNVPVNAIIQHRPDPDSKGRVIAAGAFLSWVGILLASGVYYLFADVFDLKPHQMFLAGAILSLIGTIYCLQLVPDSLVRFLLWLLTKSAYRIRVEGRDNIPEKGGALFVCNHVSFVDAPLLMAATDRKIRFLMHREYYNLWWIKPFTKMLGLIPIASDLGPREMIESLRAAGDAIRSGRVVCIFAEGKITRTGDLDEFHRGFERIMRGNVAPIVPVALVGVWGSVFSFENGKFFWKWPKKIPYHVTIRFGKNLPATALPQEVHDTVKDLLNSGQSGNSV
ncbi:MAG TPA: MFS transporter [Verrucomicrobiae bacterium]|jgi:acyl-[acyl-carrier-protein]-phospholipid O-acyltransferase/long-chain-fatty-acid--[acyl-carrier-protein] ligase